MADDERRAEIEAVARALTDWPDEWDEHDEGDKEVFRRMAADGIAALDRVRDARGNDEEPCPRCGGEKVVFTGTGGFGNGYQDCPVCVAARSPQGEDHGVACHSCWVLPGEPHHPGCTAQGEDHEAAVRALMKRWIDQANAERYTGGPNTSPMVEPDEYDIDDPPKGMEEQARLDVECVVAALSPSRDGSVAVEDVEKLQAAIDKAYGAINSSAYVGGPSESEAWQTAMAVLGEVVTQHKGMASPASTGDQEENDERRP